MKKAGFIGSVISVFLGALMIAGTSFINEIMPKIGYLAFKKSSSGSYTASDYAMNFTSTNIIAASLIIGGLVFGAYCFISDKRSK